MGQTVAVVLAAGLGTRMKSKLPKMLHKVVGVPMIQHVINTLKDAGVEDVILVLGYQGDLIEKALGYPSQVVYQHEPLGTGNALLQALPQLKRYTQGNCLVVCGDTPLLRAETLLDLKKKHTQSEAQATVLTAQLADPAGYGRIVRGLNGVERIVEEKDANQDEKSIKEINTGTYCFNILALQETLHRLSPSNAQGEYYLTDIVKILAESKERVESFELLNPQEAMGINNRVQLAEAERIWQRRILEKLMLAGATILDPDYTYIGPEVEIGKDTIVYPGVIIEGQTSIGEDCIIGPYSRIISSTISHGVSVNMSYLLEVKVGNSCIIGPYSFLRPGTILGENVKVGDFVEIKNSRVENGSKIPHLSYVGDSILGQKVNVGAGTITCNYDGEKKHQTNIGDGAFIGSNSNLVAPINIGAGAYIGAGSTVTKDIPAGSLAIARGKQRNIEDWNAGPKNKTSRDKDGEE